MYASDSTYFHRESARSETVVVVCSVCKIINKNQFFHTLSVMKAKFYYGLFESLQSLGQQSY